MFYRRKDVREFAARLLSSPALNHPLDAPTRLYQEQSDEQRQSQSTFDAVARGRVGLTLSGSRWLRRRPALMEPTMLRIYRHAGDRMADALERVGVEIDAVSRDVFRTKARQAASTASSRDLRATLEQIGRNGDLLTKLRESLVSINRLLTYHSTMEVADKKAAKARAKTLHRDVIALSDQSTFLSQKINFMLDATLGLINLEQNQIIKIFSVAAVIFLPPTLVASIYGMNFEQMPELKWVFGYPLAIAFMISSAVLPYLRFKRRGWL